MISKIETKENDFQNYKIRSLEFIKMNDGKISRG